MHRGLLIIAACLALALAGCGSDSSSSSSSSTTPASTGEETTSQSSEKSSEQEKKSEGPSELSPKQAAKLKKPKVKVPNGPPPEELVIKELRKGTGATAEVGDEVVVQYVGVDYKTGKQFDASWDRGEPFAFTLGAGMVIPGWDQGVQGMRVGGQRELIIPPELAYGSQQAGSIKPNSTLVFVIDLLAAG
jgi:peptidylprolyl isomerase